MALLAAIQAGGFEQVAAPVDDNRAVTFDSMPLDEFERRRAANYARGRSPGRKPRGRVSRPKGMTA